MFNNFYCTLMDLTKYDQEYYLQRLFPFAKEPKPAGLGQVPTDFTVGEPEPELRLPRG